MGVKRDLQRPSQARSIHAAEQEALCSVGDWLSHTERGATSAAAGRGALTGEREERADRREKTGESRQERAERREETGEEEGKKQVEVSVV